MVHSNVLVLNKSFLPVHITTVRRAFCLLYAGLAKAVNSQYETFDFDSWRQISIERNDETIGLVGRGFATQITPAFNESLQAVDCKSCGQCIATCPAGAIIFGDLHDRSALVSQLIFKDPRRYQLLGDLNTKPGLVYLQRVRREAGE